MEEGAGRYKIVATGLLALVFLIGLALLLLRLPPQDEALVIAIPTPTASPPREIKVYVSGAVQQAGVYTLREEDRIEDALRAAGGTTPGADLSRLNLAARVRDEMHIYVPQPGEEPLPPPETVGATARINLNTASAAQLEELPGIGPVRAGKIISYRQKNGPFRRIEELLEAKLVGPSTFQQIKDRITVR
jgi:competence protein ComEA